jgi:hypothetical protein
VRYAIVRDDKMRIGKKRGSYLPILTTLVENTTGPILELGVGFCSTPYLHWSCYPQKRKLVSIENNPEYYMFANSWRDDFHTIHCTEDFDEINLARPWSIAFVDHSPSGRRHIDIKRLTHADYVVVHDSENSNDKKYHLSRVLNLYKYRWKYDDAFPYTSVWSNKYEINHETFSHCFRP